MKLNFSIYRYNPDIDDAPHMKGYTLDVPEGTDMMVLDALILLKEQDPSIAFRRSCREGVCGSDGINMNGKNGLACITPLSTLMTQSTIVIRPLPGVPVIRDLIIDMEQFYSNYAKVKPFLMNGDPSCSRAFAISRRTSAFRWIVRMHYVCVLLNILSFFLVES